MDVQGSPPRDSRHYDLRKIPSQPPTRKEKRGQDLDILVERAVEARETNGTLTAIGINPFECHEPSGYIDCPLLRA